MSTSLRVSEATRARAAVLASHRGSSIGEIVDEALDAYERAEFWRRTRDAFRQHGESAGDDPAWDRAVRDDLDRE